MFTSLNTVNDEAIEKLPQALAIQKKKLLIAINETNDATAANISEEDEQLVIDVAVSLGKLLNITPTKSLQWKDSISCKVVKDTLHQHAFFQLSKYLECATAVCATFSTKQRPSPQKTIDFKMEYVLTHARQFGDPSKTIFQIEATAKDQSIHARDLLSKRISGYSTIVSKVCQLTEELREAYDEAKFQTLNTLITSFVLLILRRVMKSNSINIDSNRFTACKCLIIEAYLNCDDEKTKKNIRDTCGKYMEWYDMQLPCLFFKVIDLYGIGASELWDFLVSVQSRKIAASLIRLAAIYYNNYKLLKADPPQSQQWFPYCRLLRSDFHKRLSNKYNVCICAILGNLVKRKYAVEEPAYNYICPDDADHVKEWADGIAADLFSKINK